MHYILYFLFFIKIWYGSWDYEFCLSTHSLMVHSGFSFVDGIEKRVRLFVYLLQSAVVSSSRNPKRPETCTRSLLFFEPCNKSLTRKFQHSRHMILLKCWLYIQTLNRLILRWVSRWVRERSCPCLFFTVKIYSSVRFRKIHEMVKRRMLMMAMTKSVHVRLYPYTWWRCWSGGVNFFFFFFAIRSNPSNHCIHPTHNPPIHWMPMGLAVPCWICSAFDCLTRRVSLTVESTSTA